MIDGLFQQDASRGNRRKSDTISPFGMILYEMLIECMYDNMC